MLEALWFIIIVFMLHLSGFGIFMEEIFFLIKLRFYFYDAI